jgi:endonuclease-3
MSKKIEHIDKLFESLKKEIERYDMPVVSHPDWDDIEKTPFTTLISCLLSLRTKDEVTAKASYRLFKRFDTPDKFIKASEEDIQKLIYPVGFYKIKAKRIKEISKTLIENYNGKVPYDFNELLKLKGVGRKTANIVMVYGHNKKGFLPIDTHCHRIPNRLGWIKTKTPEQTEEELKRVLPKKYWDDFNHLFVKFGQTICVPISPFCSRCPINKYCKKIGVEKNR